MTVSNDIPIITDLNINQSIDEDSTVVININDLVIEDDNRFPEDFILTIGDGDNYSLNENKIIPSQDFNGVLNIPLTVFDGNDESEVFTFELSINPVNDAPEIVEYTGSTTILKNGSLDISISDFIVSDVDNDISDFSLSVFEGENYKVEGSRVSPDLNFLGLIEVLVTVDDGMLNSPELLLSFEVIEVLSLENEIQDRFTIYPNPTSGKVVIDGLSSILNVDLYQLSGIREQQDFDRKKDGTIEISLHNRSEGVYFILIQTEEGIISKRVIKVHNKR